MFAWAIEVVGLQGAAAANEPWLAFPPRQEITITRKQGSFTLEESLTDLVKLGLVDRRDALTRAVHPEELEWLLG